MRTAARRRRAVMLILVLWIVTILSLLAYSIIYTTTLETRITGVRKRGIRAEALARAGLAKGFADLRNDLINDLSEEQEIFDSEGDYWAVGDDDKTDIEFEEGEGSFTVVVQDENRLLNLNAISTQHKALLVEIVEMIGYEEEDAKIVAAAIIDYADGDEDASIDNPSQNEGVTYAVFAAESAGERTIDPEEIEPLAFPNEPYRTVDQLLDVYGVTPELFFGPGSPEAEHFRREMELGVQARRGESFIIKERRRRRDEPVLGLRDFFTVSDIESLNINTAQVHVLEALLRAAGRTDGDRVAESVVKQRRGGRTRRIKSDDAFKNLQEVQDFGDLAGSFDAMTSMHNINVTSTHFTLTSTGTVGDVRSTLSVTVRREMIDLQRSETFESRDNTREREDRYLQRRKRHTNKDDELQVRYPAIYIEQWNPT